MQVGINAFFWNRQDTGSGQYLRRLVDGLLAQEEGTGYSLFLAQSSTPNSWPHRLRPSVSTPPLFWGENLAKVWFEQISFPCACDREEVAVAHVPYFAPPLFPTVPTVVTIHDLIPFILPEYRKGARLALYNWLIARGAKRATAIIVDSTATKKDLLRLFPISEERIRVIYLATGQNYHPAPVADIERVRQKYSLPEKYLLYLGGFDLRKNLTVLFKALAQLAPYDFPLVIAGKSPEKETLLFPEPRRLAFEAGVEKRVQFIGWVAEEDKPALYSGASIFLFPSLYEGFGLPPLEAMACGAPVIAANSSSLPEVIGEGGMLVAPQDAQAWAEAIARLLENLGAREEWGARGKEQAQRFSWRKTAEETRAVYEELAEH